VKYFFKTRLGGIEFSESDRGVKSVKFFSRGKYSRKLSASAIKVRDFLNGRKVDLNGIPLDLGDTRFRVRVWSLTRRIPYGETRTYGWLAGKLKSSPRAVGQALKKNPVPLIIPCHRVISSNGLGGFSCGVRLKRKLLEMEGALKSAYSPKRGSMSYKHAKWLRQQTEV